MTPIPVAKGTQVRLLLMSMASLLYGAAPALSAQIEVPGAGRVAAVDQAPAEQGLQLLPPDAELEAAGARIGTIDIHIKQIFELDDPRENNWLFGAADHVHVLTRQSTIRAQLLFRSGDRYSRRLLEESARNMRQNSPFLREPQIRPIRYHNGMVDIEVITHDVWTFQPGVNFSRSGGTNTFSFDFSDANFLGYGKFIEVGHGQDVDRRSTFVSWGDPNVWGSHWHDAVVYSDNSDGRVWGLDLDHPFYSLETLYNGGVDTGENRSIVRRYSLGHIYDGYDRDYRTSDLYAGKALSITDLWTERLLLGWRIDRSQFNPVPGQSPLAPLPQDRDLSYPFARMQWVENTFDTTRNLDLIARTEDVHYGLNASVGLGWATPSLGSDRNSVLPAADITYGWRYGQGQQLFLSSRLGGRFEQGQLHDGLASAFASYYLATSNHSRMLLRFSGDLGHDLDGDHYLELGGDTGLRGYPLRYQNGNERALFTVEERLYTDWYLFRLVNIGAAAFYDMGRTWGTTPVPAPQLGLLRDAGVGLRLGNARSSFGSVVHIDLAVPLDRSSGISALQFLVSTQQTF